MVTSKCEKANLVLASNPIIMWRCKRLIKHQRSNGYKIQIYCMSKEKMLCRMQFQKPQDHDIKTNITVGILSKFLVGHKPLCSVFFAYNMNFMYDVASIDRLKVREP